LTSETDHHPVVRDWPLRGERVSIWPLRHDELDLLLGLIELLGRSASPTGVPDRERFRGRIDRSGEMRDGGIDLRLEVDGKLIGMIQTHRNRQEDISPDVFEVGIAIYRSEDRGREAGTEAMRLFVDWLFEEQGGCARRGWHGRDERAHAQGVRGPGVPGHGPRSDPRRGGVLYELSRGEWEQSP
jgi:hypothetical protein